MIAFRLDESEQTRLKGTVTMSPSTSRAKRWVRAWLHSDLVGIPVTLAACAIMAGSFALYLLIGRWAGLFVGKLIFITAMLGLFGLILLLEGRHGESTEAVAIAPLEGPRRVLIVANEGLEQPALCAEVCRPHGRAREAMILAPVVADSWLHQLTDDVDVELHRAQERVDAAVATLKEAGVDATGRVDIGSPMTCLTDGLRQFAATDVVMLANREPGWKDAENLAEQVKTDLGLRVTEVHTSEIAIAA